MFPFLWVFNVVNNENHIASRKFYSFTMSILWFRFVAAASTLHHGGVALISSPFSIATSGTRCTCSTRTQGSLWCWHSWRSFPPDTVLTVSPTSRQLMRLERAVGRCWNNFWYGDVHKWCQEYFVWDFLVWRIKQLFCSKAYDLKTLGRYVICGLPLETSLKI